MRLAHIFILLLLFCLGLKAQSTEPVKADPGASVVEDLYLARDDGGGKAGDVTSTFSPGDVPIHCIVVLSKSDPIAVKMNFVAVEVAGVKPESRVVSAAYTTRQGQDRVFFTGRPDGQWVAGSYRIDIFVDGKLQKGLAFEVKGNAVPIAVSNFVSAKPKPKPARKKN